MPTKLLIDGGAPLRGVIAVTPSKNALLPIIAGTILTEGVTVLRNVPRITDIDNLLHILLALGIKVKWQNGDLVIDTREIGAPQSFPVGAAGKIRGSIFVLGAILGRFKRSAVPYPGGCAIGERPIDLHLQAFKDLGVRVTEKNGLIECKKAATRQAQQDVYLDFPSVGATENVLLACALGRNRVRIHNAAREPEVVDLCNFLNACGAMICGHGTSTITVAGVTALCGTSYTAIPDRINTGSYLLAAAACGGHVKLTNVVPAHNENLIAKLRKSGCDIRTDTNSITITREGGIRVKPLGTVHTAPWPGFPTDLQSQLATLQAVSKGVTAVTENLFENRFKHLAELQKLGAKVCIKNKTAIVTGVRNLVASSDERAPLELFAGDLRGGVALVIAALCARGTSVVKNAEYIYRGHAEIERDLAGVGANIIRIDE